MITLDSNRLQALSVNTLHSDPAEKNSVEKNKPQALQQKLSPLSFSGNANDVFLYRSENTCPFNTAAPTPNTSLLQRFFHAVLGSQQIAPSQTETAGQLKALEPITSNDWQILYPGWLG